MSSILVRPTAGGQPDSEMLLAFPHKLIELTTTRKFSFGRRQLEDLQLAMLKKRFVELVDRVAILGRFAGEQKLAAIETLEDGALLLFPHTVYKSYPLSAVERSRYEVMTKWIGSLTACDISRVDAGDCQSIDDWVDALDAGSDLRVRHSSGTSGKLSFVPLSQNEARSAVWGMKRSLQGFGDEPDAEAENFGTLPLIAFGYRHGSQTFPRAIETIIHEFYDSDESRVLCMNTGHLSADIASFAGRLASAQSRGAVGRKQLSPALMQKREEYIRTQANAPKYLDIFLERISDEYRGQRVVLDGMLPATVMAATAGIQRGFSGLFDAESPFLLAGGGKGFALPDDFRGQVEQFTGCPFPRQSYGMSEAVSAVTRMCPGGHYHVVPNLIAYILDPESGAVLPRAGVHKGRLGLIDLACQTRWGGFLTGDEVTLNFDGGCDCGRQGAYIGSDIRRYSEMSGGDDKITCAGTPGLHERALAILSAEAEGF